MELVPGKVVPKAVIPERSSLRYPDLKDVPQRRARTTTIMMEIKTGALIRTLNNTAGIRTIQWQTVPWWPRQGMEAPQSFLKSTYSTISLGVSQVCVQIEVEIHHQELKCANLPVAPLYGVNMMILVL